MHVYSDNDWQKGDKKRCLRWCFILFILLARALSNNMWAILENVRLHALYPHPVSFIRNSFFSPLHFFSFPTFFLLKHIIIFIITIPSISIQQQWQLILENILLCTYPHFSFCYHFLDYFKIKMSLEYQCYVYNVIFDFYYYPF